MRFYHRLNALLCLEDDSDIIRNTWTSLRFPLVCGFVASTGLQAEHDGGSARNADDLDTTCLPGIGYQCQAFVSTLTVYRIICRIFACLCQMNKRIIA